MLKPILFASALALAFTQGAPAAVQTSTLRTDAPTHLNVVASGEVTRVPDVARISTGVVTQARTATEAISQNAQQMSRVIAALRRLGIAERDIQTSNVSLNPDYRYVENQPPVLTGYRAVNEVAVRFRDIKDTGRILDALVAQGANQINGPMLTIDKPEEALDEARQRALAKARERAEVYARALGKRVVAITSVSEMGSLPQPMPAMEAMAQSRDASTKIVPGEQALSATLSVSFELR